YRVAPKQVMGKKACHEMAAHYAPEETGFSVRSSPFRKISIGSPDSRIVSVLSLETLTFITLPLNSNLNEYDFHCSGRKGSNESLPSRTRIPPKPFVTLNQVPAILVIWHPSSVSLL